MKRAEQTDNDGNSSFISNVLDFVSRELNYFVANAAGVAVAVVRPQSCHIRPSDDRRNLSHRRAVKPNHVDSQNRGIGD